MTSDKQNFGLIGLAVMGENLALNIERNGFSMSVYNRGFLIMICAIVAIVSLFFSLKRIHRTRYGDRFLSNLRDRIPKKVFGMDDLQLPLIVALLSVAILPNEAFADLKGVLTPVSSGGGDSSSDSSYSSSDGGSSDGGGCGGGGCGGCGGGD